MRLLAVLATLMAVWSLIRWWCWLASLERVRISPHGLWSVELRRQTLVTRDGIDLQEFPQPREVRVLLMRCAGLPVWQQKCWISLPQHLDARIDQVGVQEYDLLFDGDFRVQVPAQVNGWWLPAVRRHRH